jgi:hypothetical protein
MDTGTKFATSAFQHDDHVTLNAQGHEHSFIDRIQHLTSHKVLGNHHDPLITSHLINSHLINLMPCHQTSLCGSVFIIYDPYIETSLSSHDSLHRRSRSECCQRSSCFVLRSCLHYPQVDRALICSTQCK